MAGWELGYFLCNPNLTPLFLPWAEVLGEQRGCFFLRESGGLWQCQISHFLHTSVF